MPAPRPPSPRLLTLVALGLALALRVPTLTVWPVWLDEVFTLYDATHTPPPYALQFWLTEVSVWLLGPTPLGLRLLPCVAGLATVLLLACMRPRSGGAASASAPVVAGVAALLLAASCWHVFMSQNARYYALQALAVLLAHAALGGALPVRGVGRYLLACGALAAALLCHPSAVFVVPALFVPAFVRLPPARRRVVGVSALIAAALGVLLYLPLLDGYLAAKGGGSLLQLVRSYGFLAGPAMLTAALVGAWPTRGRRPPDTALVVLASGATFGIASLGLFVTGYHAFATFPLVVLLAAHGLVRLPRGPRLVLAAVLALELVTGQVLYHASHGIRPRWPEAARTFEAAVAAGARGYATRPQPLAYLRDPAAADLRLPQDIGYVDSWTLAELAKDVEAGRPVVVLVHPDDPVVWPADARRRWATIRDALRNRTSFPAAFGPKPLTLEILANRPLPR